MADKFDWFQQDSNEEVLWKGTPKLNSIYPTVGLGILLLPVGGLGLLLIIGSYLYIKNVEFVVSSKALYKKTGILSRKVQKVKFPNIQDTSYGQSFFGRYFGYGNVNISTAGSGGIELKFNAVEDPEKLQSIINQRIEDETQSVKSEQSGTGDSEVLTELRKIREQLEELNQKMD